MLTITMRQIQKEQLHQILAISPIRVNDDVG